LRSAARYGAEGAVSSAGRAIFESSEWPMTRRLDRSTVGPVQPRLDPRAVDLGLAAVLTVGLELEVWLGTGASGERLPAALLGGAVAAAVAVRRRYPGPVGLLAVVAAGVLAAVWGAPSIVSWGVAWLCCMYALATWAPTPQFVAGLGLSAAGILLAFVTPGTPPASAAQFTVVTMIVMLLVRRVLGDRERRARLAERERDVAAREAVLEERARIARELHDAIAHNVSMMVVQAGAERRVLDGDRGSTREVLETIEQIGRGALTEMRRLVGMLRADTSEPLAPQPGLDDLSTLVAQVRDAGLPVELDVEGERRQLPVGIELSAYRIVQEALTNALKHAGDARASVRVRYRADSLELEIVDDGAGGPARASGGGHGLAGMRERVALYGGRLDAGRRQSGGFAVRVLLPIR
jgi:signal transduction histidine kinase